MWGWPGRRSSASLLAIPGPLHSPCVRGSSSLLAPHPTSHISRHACSWFCPPTSVRQPRRPAVSKTGALRHLDLSLSHLPHPPQCLHLLSPLLSCRDPYVSQPFRGASRSPLCGHFIPRHPTLPRNWTLASPFHTWGPLPHEALLQLQPSGLLQPQKPVVPHATSSVTFCTGLTPSKKGGLSHCIPAPETLGTDLLPRSPFLMVSPGV